MLAACGSAKGASRFLITRAMALEWELVSSAYCAEETKRNVAKLGRTAVVAWSNKVKPRVRFHATGLVLDKPLVFPKAKDRPVVIAALSLAADWLLTLDETDFQQKLGREVYDVRIATPGEFLLEQRSLGLL